MNKKYRILGRVIERISKQGIPGLRVEAWDKDLIIDDLLGSAITDTDGTFLMSFDESYFRELCLDRYPDLYFKIFDSDKLITSTENSVLWNVHSQDKEIVIELEIDFRNFGESNKAKAEPNKVSGAPFPPVPVTDEEDKELNEDEGREVFTGPFRGLLSVTQQFKLLDIKSGSAGDDSPDPVVFEKYTPYGTTVQPLSSTNAADISGADSGNVVLASGNFYAAYSVDGGNTFTRIDPTTVFPNNFDGGFCCDQIIQYVPSIDRFIWLMQFRRAMLPTDTSGNPTGPNRYRLAAASPQDIINSNCTAWTYWDLTSATFNLGNNWMDYPDLGVGNNFLYLSADQFGTGLLVVRIPLDEIRRGVTININYTNPADSSTTYGSHVSQNTGDEVFWAGHIDNATLQVFSWKEDSGTYFWRNVNVGNWPNNTISSVAPNSVDWLNKLDNFPRFGVIGATRRNNEVWFAWSASSGDGGHGGFNFPHPHIQVVKIDLTNYNLIEQMQIWNPDHAFAYPSLATNSRGEVGISLGWGGNIYYANNAVGILGDFIVWYPELSDTATLRWGDYVTARQSSPNSGLFAGFGYAILKDSTVTAGYRFYPYYILFGRKSVVNPPPR